MEDGVQLIINVRCGHQLKIKVPKFEFLWADTCSDPAPNAAGCRWWWNDVCVMDSSVWGTSTGLADVVQELATADAKWKSWSIARGTSLPCLGNQVLPLDFLYGQEQAVVNQDPYDLFQAPTNFYPLTIRTV